VRRSGAAASTASGLVWFIVEDSWESRLGGAAAKRERSRECVHTILPADKDPGTREPQQQAWPIVPASAGGVNAALRTAAVVIAPRLA